MDKQEWINSFNTRIYFVVVIYANFVRSIKANWSSQNVLFNTKWVSNYMFSNSTNHDFISLNSTISFAKCSQKMNSRVPIFQMIQPLLQKLLIAIFPLISQQLEFNCFHVEFTTRSLPPKMWIKRKIPINFAVHSEWNVFFCGPKRSFRCWFGARNNYSDFAEILPGPKIWCAISLL